MSEDKSIHLFQRFLNNSPFSFRNEKRALTKFEAFVDLVDNADDQGVTAGSLSDLKKRWNWPYREQVNRFLRFLVKKKYLSPPTEGMYKVLGYAKWVGVDESDPEVENYKAMTERLVDHLAKITNKDMFYSEKRRTLVTSVMKAYKGKVTEADLILILSHFYNQWKNDEKMSRYIRMETLFGKEKFPGYLEEARAAKLKNKSKSFFNAKNTHQ